MKIKHWSFKRSHKRFHLFRLRPLRSAYDLILFSLVALNQIECRSEINCVTPAILIRLLFSSPCLGGDKNVTRIWKQVSGTFWSQNKEWRNYAEIRAETTAHSSKIRDLRQKRNMLSLKSYLKHKLNILGSNENNFLNNIRQSSWSRELRIKLRLTCFSHCPLTVATWQTN